MIYYQKFVLSTQGLLDFAMQDGTLVLDDVGDFTEAHRDFILHTIELLEYCRYFDESNCAWGE